MNDDYVTYKQARRLKELGFDWRCINYYDGTNKHTIYTDIEYRNFNNSANYLSAPSLALAQKWLREKGFEVCACSDYEAELPNGKWMAFYKEINQPLYATNFLEETYDSYEKALSNGITKMLELISNGKV